MYIYINMAKTIMIADTVYADLKDIKEKEGKSYSEVLSEMIEHKKTKTVRDSMKHFGILKGDKEYDEVMKKAKNAWARWTKRYV